jgi:hypothetical protein
VSDRDEIEVPEQVVETLTIRDDVLDELLDKVRSDRYPSATMMDDVEKLLTPWRRREYAEVLLEKVRDDRFPSRSLIQRLIRLAG